MREGDINEGESQFWTDDDIMSAVRRCDGRTCLAVIRVAALTPLLCRRRRRELHIYLLTKEGKGRKVRVFKGFAL